MKIIISALLVASVLLMASCQPVLPKPVDPDQPVSSDDPPAPTASISDNDKYVISEMTYIDSIDVLVLESWPLQVNAVIKGNLPDGCTVIHQVQNQIDGTVFNIKIFTIREKEAFCTEALVPFEEVVPLDVYGLPAGTYTVKAYGASAEFTFESDNVIQEPSSG